MLKQAEAEAEAETEPETKILPTWQGEGVIAKGTRETRVEVRLRP